MCRIVCSCFRINVCGDCINYLFYLRLEILNWISGYSNYWNVFNILVGGIKCWGYFKLNLLCWCWSRKCVLNIVGK